MVAVPIVMPPKLRGRRTGNSHDPDRGAEQRPSGTDGPPSAFAVRNMENTARACGRGEPRRGGDHECASPGCPFGGSVDGAAVRPCTERGACGRVGLRGYASRRIHPGFLGIWSHPYLPGFEPPSSGPGPVLNRSRSRNGVSQLQTSWSAITPIRSCKPEAAEIVKKHGEISLAGEGYPTPSNQCWPGRRALRVLGLS